MRPSNDVSYPIHDLIRNRWSPRAFSSRTVEVEKLRSILEAARWAPSSNNEQPWRFIIATIDNPAEHQRLLECLVEQNQRWARSAPVLIIACTHLAFNYKSKPNRHAFYDAGQSVAYLTVQATALGLHVHQMAGFSVDQARQTYAIPASAEPVTALALGYLGDPATLPDELRQREESPGQRRPLAESVFTSTWGKPAGLF